MMAGLSVPVQEPSEQKQPARLLRPADVAAASLVSALERLYVVFGILVLTGALIPLLRGLDAADGEVADFDPVRRISLLLVYAGAALFTLPRLGEVLRAAGRAPYLLALLALALLSAAWSPAPEMTLNRAVAFGGATLFGCYLGARFSARDLLSLVAVSLAVIAILSVGLAVFTPWLGISSVIHEGAWRGVFVHKNGLGWSMALAALTFLVIATGRTGAARIAWGGAAGGAAALVVLSQSTSALVLLLAMLPLLGAMRLLRWEHPLRTPLVVSLGLLTTALVLAASAGAASLLALLGRDPTLTGRTELWGQVVTLMDGRLLGGYGYGAFWRGTAEAEILFRAVGWEPWHAHNGYLDALLHLGIVGLLLALVGSASALLRHAAEYRRQGGGVALWPLACLAFLLLANLTESSLLQHNALTWPLLVGLAVLPAVSGRDALPIHMPAGVSPGIRRHLRRTSSRHP
jgi:exopolysaccharide production protein ExoQ